MYHFEDYLQENIDFKDYVDPNTFEEFWNRNYVDHGYLFTAYRIFNSKVELVDWAKETAMKANTYLIIIIGYLRSRTSDHRPYVTLTCERVGTIKSRTRPRIDDEEEEVPIKRWDPYETKKCSCPFKLKGKRHIDQNVLAKLTEMIKDEDITSRFVNGSWHKLLNEIDEGDLDTVFLNIDLLIEGQIAEIKSSLEFSRLKEKFNAKSNPILKNISNNISHLTLKKIWVEIKRAPEIIHDPINKCEHYLRKSHGLPCSYPGTPLTTPPEHTATKGRQKTSSTKRDKSYWEHVSIAHRKIGKSSKSGSGSGSGFGSGSRGRGRSSRAPRGRGRGRGCSSGRNILSFVIDPSTLSTFSFVDAFPGFVYHFIEIGRM
ncbi:hypothetical protein M9H77_18162 [Catharanthus roseus]|uniref:Uncharacterized protein n=1 Tax=Catharanthus roseus TaxID=4058 RepID=A0ACC0B6N3_CATRO|nr:hypothetical protein M9H77_18162 [Catharanthus roseus]